MSEDSLHRAFLIQAQACGKLGSGFYQGLMERAAAALADERLACLFTPWRGRSIEDLFVDAVPLRFLGALHELASSGDAPDLAAAFPPTADPEAAWRAALDAAEPCGARLAAFMTHEPQTNEVRRSACLTPGFLVIAQETDLPLRCFELGASAGLNQLWSRFHYDFGAAGVWGDEASPVRLDTDWRGPAPAFPASVRVLETAACDRKPIDITDPEQRRRLRAYLWPDQTDRLARFDAAAALAAKTGVRVEAEDAVTWAERRARPSRGAASVLFHSSFWQYLPDASQSALAAVISRLGEAAGRDAPFAWLRKEPAMDNMTRDELRLTLWPGGEERLLALAHPHGAWIDWAA